MTAAKPRKPRSVVCLLAGEKYAPGGPAPEGYLAWHEWAGVQHRAGLRQRPCAGCGKWRFPQETCCTGTLPAAKK